MPEMKDRPRSGGAVLVERTQEGHEMTQRRVKRWLEFMEKAEPSPETYSRWVSLPAQDEGLVGRKIEVRIQLETEVAGEDGKTATGTFLHCFEGTATAVRKNDKGTVLLKVRSIHGTRAKWAVAEEGLTFWQ